MKYSPLLSLKNIFFLTILASQQLVYANAPDQNNLTVDLAQKRFLQISNDISLWITNGGPNELQLPAGLTLDIYKAKMLQVLDSKNTQVTFLETPVIVSGVEKTCANFLLHDMTQQTQYQIQCNLKRFIANTDDENYSLVHHEYAGLAGIEVNQNSNSEYFISKQISEFLTNQSQLRLNTKRQWVSRQYAFNFSPMINQVTVQQEQSACAGSMCRLLSISINDKGLATGLLIDRVTYGVLYTYLKDVFQNDPATILKEERTRAEQTMISFYTVLAEVLGKKIETKGLEEAPARSNLAAVVVTSEGAGKVISIYVDKSVYQYIRAYFQDNINNTPGDSSKYDQVSFAFENTIQLYCSLIEATQRPDFTSAKPVSADIQAMIITNFTKLIDPTLFPDGQFPLRFTLEEQMMILLYVDLLGNN
jgi:hypothetical protein